MNHNDQKFIAQKIRAQYMEKEITDLEELRALDAKVKRPTNVFAYLFGSFSAIIMGAGMSLVMTELGSHLSLEQSRAMVIGIAVGLVGCIPVALAYPIYRLTLKRERKKIAPQILRLTDELMK